jgi:hypothetical protein
MRKQFSLPLRTARRAGRVPLLLLALAALPALAQQGAPKAPPYSTQSGNAAQLVVPMVWDASVAAFVPQGSGYVAQTFAGTGTLQIATAGIGTVTVQATGSGAGLAFVFQGSSDGGTSWQTLPGFVPSSGAAAASFSANGVWQANPAGFTLFRVNLSAISSGAETFTVTTSTAQAVFNGANISVSASIAANSSVNVNQVGGTAVDSNSGNKSAGTQRVVIATDQPQLTNAMKVDGSGVTQPVSGTVNAAESGTWTVQPGNTANTTPWLVKGNDGTNSWTVKAAGTAPAAADTAVVVAPSPNTQGCGGQAIASTIWTPLNITANTKLVSGTSSKQTYICHVDLVVSAADNVAIVEGTGAVCGTSTAGIFGGATAAAGWNLAANGGIATGAGQGIIGKTATAADDVCVLVSSGAQVSGMLVSVQF